MDGEKYTMWDPIGEDIQSNSFSTEQESITKKVQMYENHPYLILLFLSSCCLVPLLAVWLLIMDKSFDIRILFFSFIPVFLYYQYLARMQEELILYLLCKKNHWAYKPKNDEVHIKKLITKYPNIFNQGYNQTVEDQIWGNISQIEAIDFWRSTFSYQTGYGRSTKTHTKAVFILKLNSTVLESFLLVHAGFFGKFKEDIKTESEEFNNIFRIVDTNKTSAAKTQIIKTLSPSVQVRLITFAKKYPVENILFADNIMITVFKDEVWKPKFTNFLKKVAIDDRDESIFYAALTDMVQIPAEMIQFIN